MTRDGSQALDLTQAPAAVRRRWASSWWFAALTPSASAGILVKSAGAYVPQPLERPFLRWLDPAQYTLLPGGTFESTLTGWTLSGARVVSGNEPYYVHGKSGKQSLSDPLRRQGDLGGHPRGARAPDHALLREEQRWHRAVHAEGRGALRAGHGRMSWRCRSASPWREPTAAGSPPCRWPWSPTCCRFSLAGSRLSPAGSPRSAPLAGRSTRSTRSPQAQLSSSNTRSCLPDLHPRARSVRGGPNSSRWSRPRANGP